MVPMAARGQISISAKKLRRERVKTLKEIVTASLDAVMTLETNQEIARKERLTPSEEGN